jgi:phage head maturation protease
VIDGQPFEESPATTEAPDAPILYRSSSVVGVNYAQRIIELVAAPYNEEAIVMWRGEPWRELFERGAWDGIEKRPNRVKANREHDKTRTVGKVINFWPSRSEGLVTATRIAKTPLGDETLALADDECLGASVGYAAPPRYVELDKSGQPGLRRVKRAFMDHLSFVSDPTWESAAVLSVRSATPPSPATELPPLVTPALDELREWLQARKQA